MPGLDNTNPLFRPFLGKPDAQPVLGANIAMPNPTPALVAPISPMVSRTPPTQTETDTAERNRLINTGSGIDQIQSKPARVAARVGDIVSSIFAPNVAQFIPGTTLHHNMLVNQATRNVAQDQAQDESVAQVGREEASGRQADAAAEYYRQRPDIEQSKIDQKSQASHDQDIRMAAKYGQKPVLGGNGEIVGYEDDPTLLASAAQQAKIDLQQAQTDLASAKGDPNSPIYQQAERRLRIAQANATAAQIRADAYHGNYLMHAQGVGLDGQPLPGIGMLDGKPVGTSMQGTVNKSISGNAQFDDVEQGIQHTDKALQALESSGGKLSSPAMITALGHSQKGLGQWLQSQAASTLTPQERDAVVAVNAMRERILAMRKASGGNASEAQVDRMISMLPGPQTPDLDTAQRQLREVQAQLDTLRPGVPQVNRPAGKPISPASNSGPKSGDVVDGYKFKGGNPADQKNWEKQ